DVDVGDAGHVVLDDEEVGGAAGRQRRVEGMYAATGERSRAIEAAIDDRQIVDDTVLHAEQAAGIVDVVDVEIGDEIRFDRAGIVDRVVAGTGKQRVHATGLPEAGIVDDIAGAA